MVVIWAAPLKGGTQNAGALGAWWNYELSELKPIRLEAGMLPEFILGSRWLNGLRLCTPQEREYVIAVNFSEEATFFGPRERLGREAIVPREVYRLDHGDNLSKVLVLPITSAHNHAAVIPCSEIFRFYYGSSTRLANALLHGDWVLRRWTMVGSKSTFDKQSGHAYLEIGPYHANEDFRELARLQFGDVAGREAERLIRRAVNPDGTKEYPLKIRPPFTGPTRLTVRGIPYHSGSKDGLLVLEILACSGPWPFKTLEYGRAAVPHGASNERTEYAGTFRRTSAMGTGESVKIVQGENPGSNEIPLEIPGPLSPNRYRTPIHATYRDGVRCSSGARRFDAIAEHEERFAMGVGRRGSTVRRVGITEGEERVLAERLEAFIKALRALERLIPGGASIFDDVYALPDGFLQPQNIPAWSFLDSYGRKQPRHAVIARFSRDSVRWVLFDVEQRAQKIRSKEKAKDGSAVAILRSPFARAVSNSEIQRLLATIVEARGVVNGRAWAKTEFSDWRHATLRHVLGEDAQIYAGRIQAAMTRSRMQFA